MSRPNLSREVRARAGEAIRLRREIHRHPEPAFREVRTARLAAKELRAAGLEVKTGIAKTGVVGLLRGGKPGPTVLWRADMDALPVQEENRVPYASRAPGMMHACGHDAHTAIAIVAAQVLAGMREELRGNVKFCFQPAEESPGGAKPMIEEGVLENPKVDCALALHIWNQLPVGRIGVREGAVLAAADFFDLIVHGRAGHGAAPHETVDPIVLAARVILALQTVPTRRIDPLQPVVVSVCRMAGGTANNVIPDRVELGGTLRSFDRRVRAQLPRDIRRIAEGICRPVGGRAELRYKALYPPTINDPAAAASVRAQAAAVVGGRNVVADIVSLGGEDMSYFLDAVPGCYFMLGCGNPRKGISEPHHSPRFAFDESALAIGVEMAVRCVRAAASAGGSGGTRRVRSSADRIGRRDGEGTG